MQDTVIFSTKFSIEKVDTGFSTIQDAQSKTNMKGTSQVGTPLKAQKPQSLQLSLTLCKDKLGYRVLGYIGYRVVDMKRICFKLNSIQVLDFIL